MILVTPYIQNEEEVPVEEHDQVMDMHGMASPVVRSNVEEYHPANNISDYQHNNSDISVANEDSFTALGSPVFSCHSTLFEQSFTFTTPQKKRSDVNNGLISPVDKSILSPSSVVSAKYHNLSHETLTSPNAKQLTRGYMNRTTNPTHNHSLLDHSMNRSLQEQEIDDQVHKVKELEMQKSMLTDIFDREKQELWKKHTMQCEDIRKQHEKQVFELQYTQDEKNHDLMELHEVEKKELEQQYRSKEERYIMDMNESQREMSRLKSELQKHGDNQTILNLKLKDMYSLEMKSRRFDQQVSENEAQKLEKDSLKVDVQIAQEKCQLLMQNKHLGDENKVDKQEREHQMTEMSEKVAHYDRQLHIMDDKYGMLGKEKDAFAEQIESLQARQYESDQELQNVKQEHSMYIVRAETAKATTEKKYLDELREKESLVLSMERDLASLRLQVQSNSKKTERHEQKHRTAKEGELKLAMLSNECDMQRLDVSDKASLLEKQEDKIRHLEKLLNEGTVRYDTLRTVSLDFENSMLQQKEELQRRVGDTGVLDMCEVPENVVVLEENELVLSQKQRIMELEEALEYTREEQNAKVHASTTHASAKEEELDQQIKKNKKQNVTITQLQSQVAEYTARIDELQTQQETDQKQYQDTQQEGTDQTVEQEHVKTTLQAKEREIFMLSESLAATEVQLEREKLKFEQYHSNTETIKQEHDSRLKYASTQNMKLLELLKKLRAERDDLDKELLGRSQSLQDFTHSVKKQQKLVSSAFYEMAYVLTRNNNTELQ